MESGAIAQLRRLPTFVVSLAWRSYLKKLQSDPLVTKAITSAVLSVLSDVVAKRFSALPVKSSTAIKELTIGLVLRGPVVHWFHAFLDGTVFNGLDQAAPHVVAGKLFLDQFLFAPVFTALYFLFDGLSDDQPPADIVAKLRRDLADVMRSNWAVWIPANFVSYYAVPLDLRVLFGSVIGVFWNAYLISAVAQRRAPALEAANGGS